MNITPQTVELPISKTKKRGRRRKTNDDSNAPNEPFARDAPPHLLRYSSISQRNNVGFENPIVSGMSRLEGNFRNITDQVEAPKNSSFPKEKMVLEREATRATLVAARTQLSMGDLIIDGLRMVLGKDRGGGSGPPTGGPPGGPSSGNHGPPGDNGSPGGDPPDPYFLGGVNSPSSSGLNDPGIIAPYGDYVPTIKAELKLDQLPKWDGNHDTAIDYFWKVQQIAALGGYIPKALGYWLWHNLEEGSAVQIWFTMLEPSQQSYMRSHYLAYLKGIKDGYLG